MSTKESDISDLHNSDKTAGDHGKKDDNIVQDVAKDKPDKAEQLVKIMTDYMEGRTEHFGLTKSFSKKETFTRAVLQRLETYVTSYNAWKEIDGNLASTHLKWLQVCGKTEKDLEDENHIFKPSTVDNLLIEASEVGEQAEKQFLKVMDQFPDRVEVSTHLNQFKPQNVPPD